MDACEGRAHCITIRAAKTCVPMSGERQLIVLASDDYDRLVALAAMPTRGR